MSYLTKTAKRTQSTTINHSHLHHSCQRSTKRAVRRSTPCALRLESHLLGAQSQIQVISLLNSSIER
ncbi:hypothetical protein Hanom_Chr15g01363061 [Helianthus anomalus]